MERQIQIWLNKYLKEPYWTDNWDSQLDRPQRLIVRDKNGNAVAREATVKSRRNRKTWGIADYCKYCTKFLTELPEPIGNWKERAGFTTDPCIKCGIRDTLQEEAEPFIEIFVQSEKISIQEVN